MFVWREEERQESARTRATLMSDEAVQCCLKIMPIVCVEGGYPGGEGEAKVGRKELRTLVMGLRRVSKGKENHGKRGEG